MDYIGHYKKDAEEFDYFEERFGATEDDEKRLREYIISEIRLHSDIVLDAGCGSAWLASYLLPENKTVISTDLALTNVKKALEIYPYNKHYGVVCDSLNLPFKEGSFNSVVAAEIIEHVVNPENFVTGLFNCVRPNGMLLVSTPYKEVLRYTLCIHCNQKTPIHAHLHSFDEFVLTGLGRSIATKRIDYSTFGNKYLIFLRTYAILRFLPFKAWKFVDNIFNKILGKPVHIITKYLK
jgi:SAM-dependent methyltransferase